MTGPLRAAREKLRRVPPHVFAAPFGLSGPAGIVWLVPLSDTAVAR